MIREQDGSYQPNAKSRKQQERDQRRMEYRRAIESYCDQRQLLRDIACFPDSPEISPWQVTAASPRSARQSH
ncbi:PA3496 family putative envelope integrity protein [Pseudomonas phoenicis]|uniref:PA3496 family putative envelope integrity protein n=1 Tax=unclassified Pseudomonas TaxID=196821 RepID=UPI0039A244C8